MLKIPARMIVSKRHAAMSRELSKAGYTVLTRQGSFFYRDMLKSMRRRYLRQRAQNPTIVKMSSGKWRVNALIGSQQVDREFTTLRAAQALAAKWHRLQEHLHVGGNPRKKRVSTPKKRDGTKPARRTANSPTVEVLRASEMFTGLPAREVWNEHFEWPRVAPMIGPCTEIEYVSDKFDGKIRRYFHRFGKGTRVYFDDKPQRNGEHLLIIRGPFQIKPEGITG